MSQIAMPEVVPVAPAPAATPPAVTAAVEEPLPKLDAATFQKYNKLAVMMEGYHNHFRHTWNILYGACTSRKRPSNLSLRQFINLGLQFCAQLELHHTIEERHIFPVLARKMPPFQTNLEMLQQHKQIHAGADAFEAYLKKCQNGETELNLVELEGIMEKFKDVLWSHLDEEVRLLGAENMRRYWSLEEMRRFQF